MTVLQPTREVTTNMAAVSFAENSVVHDVLVPGVSNAEEDTVDVWLKNGRVQACERSVRTDSNSEHVDGNGCWLLPGFVDLQANDVAWLALGPRTPEDHAERIRAVLEYQAARGVTGIIIATLAAPIDHLRGYLYGAAHVLHERRSATSSVLLGMFVEGSFMNPQFCGAHNPNWVLPPSIEVLDQLLETGSVRMLNVAPEMSSEALSVITKATQHGVVVGVGHAKPHARHLREAVAAGARFAIHLGNGPTGTNLKAFNDGGMLEEALRNDDLVVTVIVDGYHVHPQLVRDWLRRKELNRFVAISDLGFALGVPKGEFEVCGIRGRAADDGRYLEVVSAPGSSPSNPLSSDRSNLFGAAVEMRDVFENLLNLLTVEMEGVYHRRHQAYPFFEAVHMTSQACSENPARLAGAPGRGRLHCGSRADAILSRISGDTGNHQVEVLRVFLGGNA